jgi:hypothetical protein
MSMAKRDPIEENHLVHLSCRGTRFARQLKSISLGGRDPGLPLLPCLFAEFDPLHRPMSIWQT